MVDCRLRQFYKLGSDRLSGCPNFMPPSYNLARDDSRGRLFCQVILDFVPIIVILARYPRPNPKKNMVYGTWDPMPAFTITSPYVHSRVDSNAVTMRQHYARVDLNPMPESTLTLCQSRPYLPVKDFGYGLRFSNRSCFVVLLCVSQSDGK